MATRPHDHDAHEEPDKRDSKPERLAKIIDPAGREPSDDDLADPGRMTPGAPPTEDHS